MYLDPGFGSMIVQVIIALIAGLGAYIALAKKKLFHIFKKNEANMEENHE